MSASLLDSHVAAQLPATHPGNFAAVHTAAPPPRSVAPAGCVHACRLIAAWSASDLLPACFGCRALPGCALPLQGTSRSLMQKAAESLNRLRLVQALWLHDALLHCFVPARPSTCCRRGPSRRCSKTSFTRLCHFHHPLHMYLGRCMQGRPLWLQRTPSGGAGTPAALAAGARRGAPASPSGAASPAGGTRPRRQQVEPLEQRQRQRWSWVRAAMPGQQREGK